jgi:hypothetical protein
MDIHSSSLTIDETTVLAGKAPSFELSMFDDADDRADIKFESTANSVISNAPLHLRFINVVNTAKIPFSFIAGPSQDVWTEDQGTLTWFETQLSPFSGDSPSLVVSQVGVLAQLENKISFDAKQHATGFTEILFFVSRNNDSLNEPTFTLKAIPLNSNVPSYLPSPPLSPQASGAQFLIPLDQLQATHEANLKKRKQVSDVFDNATELRRKAKRHGGESVAAAASVGGINVLVGHKKAKTVSKTQHEPLRPAARPHSRTSSFSGIQLEQSKRVLSRSPSMSSDTGRPLSRKGASDLPATKRSTLSRVSSLADTASTSERNKDAISRLVMAGMRLYGLTQRKKPTHVRRMSSMQAPSPVLSPADAEDVARAREQDEEYKLIYHQTYKAAVFAFRRNIQSTNLYAEPEKLRETVDELLALFCGNPLASPSLT